MKYLYIPIKKISKNLKLSLHLGCDFQVTVSDKANLD